MASALRLDHVAEDDFVDRLAWGTPLRAIAASAAATARSVAVRSASAPPRFPNGVRAPATMTISLSLHRYSSYRTAIFRTRSRASRQAPRRVVPKARRGYADQSTCRSHARCPVAPPCDQDRTDSRNFDKLPIGSAVEINEETDPRALRNEMAQLRPGRFSWDARNLGGQPLDDSPRTDRRKRRRRSFSHPRRRVSSAKATTIKELAVADERAELQSAATRSSTKAKPGRTSAS